MSYETDAATLAGKAAEALKSKAKAATGKLAELLPRIRFMEKAVESEKKSRKAAAMAKIKDDLDAIDKELGSPQSKLKMASEAVAARLTKEYLEADDNDPIKASKLFEGSLGSIVSIVEKDALVVTNASIVPDEYLLPLEECIDWSKVKEAGRPVPGIEKRRVFSHLLTKLKEVIE